MKATIQNTATTIECSDEELAHIQDSVIMNGGVSPLVVAETLHELMASFSDVDYNTAEGRACASFMVRKMMEVK